VTLYLDTTALVKLYVDEEGAATVRDAVAQAELIATSAIAYVEARAAFARRYRERGLSKSAHRSLVRDFERDWPRYLTVEVAPTVIRDAARLAESHRLRAYDAVHLASARTVAGRASRSCVFASWDATLERAAAREGLEPLAR
jgi:predicted nucleic acid-binding protein